MTNATGTTPGSALLPGRFVALDFETTGLSAARDRIIDIGAVECIDGEIARTFRTLVRPGLAIPAAITRLTGIDEAMVAAAPRFEEVAPELLAFLGDSPILAHNARFERDFLAAALAREVPNPFLDTLELAGLVRGTDPRRSLGHLARVCEVRDHEVHRGLEDALDCVHVTLAVLRSVVTDRRRAFVERVLRIMEGTRWGWLPVLRSLAARIEPPPSTPPLVAESRTIEPRDEPAEYQRVSAETVQRAFSEPSGLAAALPAFEPRPQQLRMAEAVAEAFSDGRSLMIEAPTGVGKSLAYLVPAGLFARANGVRVVVATHTRNLQDQLASQDLPRAAHALGGELAWAVLKGQENYVCTRRALSWLDAPPELAEGESERLLRAYVASFLELTSDGDLERFLPWHSIQGPHVARVVDRIRSSAASCSTAACRRGDGCFYTHALRNAHGADVIVTNHALALLWPERYPASRHLVVDEAHGLEDAATSRWSSSFDPAELARIFDDLMGKGRAGGMLDAAARVARAAAKDADDGARIEAWLRRTRAAAQRAAAAVGPIRFTAERLLYEGGVKAADEGRKTLRLTRAVRELPTHGDLATRSVEWVEVVGGLSRELSSMIDELGFGGAGESVARELATLVIPLESAARVLGAAFGVELDAGYVHWIEVEDVRGARAQRIRRAPVAVADLIVEHLFDRFRSVVLTSATLSLGGEGPGAFVARRLGFDKLPAVRRAPFLALSSPFDLEQQMVLGIPEDLADVNSGEPFVADVTRVVADVARRLGGRTLALFAANRRRDQVGERLDKALRGEGIDVLVQGPGGGRDRLVQALRDGGRKVVLGSRSLWEGVDVPGSVLSCVVIERLPFDFPGEPLQQAREEAVREAGGDPFQDWTLPRALLRFQQGVGRLVRSRTDRGIVLLLQSNLTKRNYAQRVLDSLPGVRVLAGPWSEILAQIDRFTDPPPAG
ncbi:MAG: helicase C-terminal domain-containing protein [bacterium]